MIKKLSHYFIQSTIFALAFIATVMLTIFLWLGVVLRYIGGTLFFLYMLIIFLPILILLKFKRFIENPRESVKEIVIKTTRKVMEY